ncbi:MAG: hypothetical protein GY846_08825 [Deltaproteobacteria bacterium]|nr:hypothetical protein [Deltaproteobacteria bacterium]
MKRLRTVLGGVLMFGLLAMIPTGCSDSDSGSSPVPPSVPTNRIYILSADNATLAPAATTGDAVISDSQQSWEYTLTLENVSDNTFWFSEKPERDSGNETTGYFFEAVWPAIYVEIAPNSILDGTIPPIQHDTLKDGLFLMLQDPEYSPDLKQIVFNVTLQNSTMDDKHPAGPVSFEDVKITIGDNNLNSGVVEWTYAQVAPLATLVPEGTEGKYILSFEKVYPECYYMSLAPDRYSFTNTVALLTDTWNNHFGGEAPNAAITSHNADGELQVNTFTLENPVYDSEAELLTYTATILSNSAEPDEYLYSPTLFIDAAKEDSCGDGFTGRLVVKNGSTESVWMILTPPGLQDSPEQQQWDWWKTKYSLKTEIKGGEPGKVFCIPDAGAPGLNLKFYPGCDSSGNNCKMGSGSINTLMEGTFGCKNNPDSKEEKIEGCAFNPSSPLCDKLKPEERNKDNCGAIGGEDWLDISAVDGFTIPVTLEVTGSTCTDQKTGKPLTGTDASMLDVASCASEDGNTLYSDAGTDSCSIPQWKTQKECEDNGGKWSKEQQRVINKGISLLTKDAAGNLTSCAAPKSWFNHTELGDPVNPLKLDETPIPPWNAANWYGCVGSPGPHDNGGVECVKGPSDGTKIYPVSLTNYVKNLKAMGYRGYTWPYDDSVGLFKCEWGEISTLTLLPKGGTPYDANNKWAYKGGKCSAGKDGSYKSLLACMQANMHYKCEAQQINAKGGGPTFHYCVPDPQATMTWEECKKSTDCKDTYPDE